VVEQSRLIEVSEVKRRGCLFCANHKVTYLPGEPVNKGSIKNETHCHCTIPVCPYEELEAIKQDFQKEYDKALEKAFKAGIKRLQMNERRDDGTDRKELFFHIERDRRVDEDGEEERIDISILGVGLGRVEEDTPGRNIHDL
jgi:hypothetical protein